MTPEQATSSLHGLLKFMLSKKAWIFSCPWSFRRPLNWTVKMTPAGQQRLTAVHTQAFAHAIMNEKQRLEFETEKECNFAISPLA